MLKALKATYVDGKLILDEKLDPEWEGKSVTIMLEVEESETEEERRNRIERFIEKAHQYRFTLPPDYKFDRNEIYDR